METEGHGSNELIERLKSQILSHENENAELKLKVKDLETTNLSLMEI